MDLVENVPRLTTLGTLDCQIRQNTYRNEHNMDTYNTPEESAIDHDIDMQEAWEDVAATIARYGNLTGTAS